MENQMEQVELTAPMMQEQPVKETKEKRGISGSTIKLIAIISMLIDHIGAAILARMLIVRGLLDISMTNDLEKQMAWLAQNGTLLNVMQIMRTIGRLGFPIFCFLLVEGFQKTRNVKKYIFRLTIFAIISEVPFDLAFSGTFFAIGYQNVFFTLLIGMAALCAFDFLKRQELSKKTRVLLSAGGILLLPGYFALFMCDNWAGGFVLQFFAICYAIFFVLTIAVCVLYRLRKGADKAWGLCVNLAPLAVNMLLAHFLHTDYAGIGVLTIAAMYAFREKKVKSMLAGCIALAGMCLLFLDISEIPAFFALIPVAFYNGKRGLKMKYFFYAFYPVHLLLLWLIALATGMGWVSLM